MKKVSLLMLVAMFLFAGNLSAQLSFDFEGYNAGDKIAATIGDPWTTWSSQPGSAEDGVFGEAGGSMAAHAYRQKKTPVLVENIQAHAGLDIGLTMIGMHLRPVAVPLRLQHNALYQDG